MSESLSDREDEDINIIANYIKLKELERKFYKCCAQVDLLDRQLQGIQIRYNRAVENGNRAMRYNLRLRLATVESIRNVFYAYAASRAEMMAELKTELCGTLILSSDYIDMGEDD
jgi:hypothetical protein